jgi:hypothetical protein
LSHFTLRCLQGQHAVPTQIREDLASGRDLRVDAPDFLTISHFSMRVDNSVGRVGRQGLIWWLLIALGHGVTDPKTLEGCGWRREFPVGEESEFSGVLGVFFMEFAFVMENRL